MGTLEGRPCPLPAHPRLADIAQALNASDAWAFILDDRWHLVYMTDEIRRSNAADRQLVPLPLGLPYFSRESIEMIVGWSAGTFTPDSFVSSLSKVGGWLRDDEVALSDVHPALRPVLAAAEAQPASAVTCRVPARYGVWAIELHFTVIRIHDEDGRVAGTLWSSKPTAGMGILGTIAAAGDPRHFMRMQGLAHVARRPAAILFGDLEGSSPLARRMSSAAYFRLGRRIVSASDMAVVDAGGIVGRHVGDGIVAYFLAEHAGSESAAARACVEAMRALRATLAEVAARSDLGPDDVVLRFGLHWGATLQVGHIVTPARMEVDALGDEMNEAARIEACATGGRALASKALMERLDPADAAALGLDPATIAYTPLGELSTATDKARRDAPAIAVCQV